MSGLRRRAALPIACGIAALALIACGDDGSREPAPSGSARAFRMGFSSLPRELNAESYAASLAFAQVHGDIVLIERGVPWQDFLPGANISDDVSETTASERDAIDDAALFFAIDPTDGATGRDRLGALPVSLAGKRFDDGDVRAAFVSYAEYVAINYKPAYMALGVEMNLYYEKNKEDFQNFRSLYAQAYAAVKKQSPSTQVTVTFQYEDLQGLLPREDTHFASWELVRAFDPDIDFIGISTYPSFAFDTPAAIPPNYYTQLRAFTEKPIAIAEMGYASQSGPGGSNGGTEEGQQAYLARILLEAAAVPMPFIVWFAIWDPTYARDTAFAPFQHIGLWRDDDTAKPAWQPWEEAARRPYVP